MGLDPTLKVLLVCYAKELSKDLLGKVRAVLAHPWYRSAFPDVAARLRINRADLIETAWGGKVIASSLSAGFTGMGADLIVVDDPLRAQSAFSERQRERCNRTFDEGLGSRLDDPARGAIVIVMQRLHEEDLVGHLRAQQDWYELTLPLVAEEPQESLWVRTAIGGAQSTRRSIRNACRLLWHGKSAARWALSFSARNTSRIRSRRMATFCGSVTSVPMRID